MTTLNYGGKEFTNRGTYYNPIYHIPHFAPPVLNKWESGWIALDHSQYPTSYNTFTHNLGTDEVIVQGFLAENAQGLNMIECQSREWRHHTTYTEPFFGQARIDGVNTVAMFVADIAGSYKTYTLQSPYHIDLDNPDERTALVNYTYNYTHLMVRVVAL